MPQSPTINDLRADGYTHIDLWCDSCRMKTLYPFRLLEEKHGRKLGPIGSMTLADIAAKMVCEKCRGKPRTFKRWKHVLDSEKRQQQEAS